MSHEEAPKAPVVQKAIDGMRMLNETDRYFSQLEHDNGLIQGEVLQKEAMEYLGQVATAMVKSCNDEELRGCQVFRVLHALYRGPAHHAAR